ncbi:MAG TPA: TolC family protein, partial [Pseudogulbenkiania sp.]|nr:TolC family protein [Pseudogulbenkiania sp.]
MRITVGGVWQRGVAITVALLAVGCAVGPDYRAPAMALPPAWHSALQGGLRAEPPPASELAVWWNRLDDPLLSRLIDEAAANNLDFRLAQARLREARARYGLAVAERYPTLNARAAVNRNRSSDEMSLGGGRVSEAWSAQLDASWELDLFGGLRRAQEAAAATVDAAEETLHDTQVSLLAEVA